MKPVGILGGGQLARMMALKAHELGIPVAVFSEKADDPAAQVVSLHHPGRLDDRKALEAFLRSCLLITFESEFLDAGLLTKLAEKTKTTILPAPDHMALLQDRLTQKALLAKHKLPTAPFQPVADEVSARDAVRELGLPLVFKKRRFGYDGYGTFVVRTRAELERFIHNSLDDPHGFIAEKFVPFERELAVMIVRGQGGSALHLPFVQTHQENSRCLWVKGPLKESASLNRLAKRLESFLAKMGYVGAMGVELFESDEGLIVNELAPRVHNSGHYSLDALTEDQFTLHLKAILGMKLETPRPLSRGFAMWNLLGSSDATPSWEPTGDIAFHWYGKSENRPGRKMGHLNALGDSPEKALKLVRQRRKYFQV